MQDEQDFYSILGVARDASEAEIRRAFRARAKAHHPDIAAASGSAGGEYDFGRLTEAYETLKDPERRQAYDEQLYLARRLASRGAGRGRQPRSLAAELALGVLFAVVVAVGGAKVYLDRAQLSPKSQESLRLKPPAESLNNPLLAKNTAQDSTPPAQPANQSETQEPLLPSKAPPEEAAVALSKEEHPAGDQALSTMPQTTPIAEEPKGRIAEEPGKAGDGTLGLDEPAEAKEANPQRLEPSRSRLAEQVLSIEKSLASNGGGVSFFRLVSLIGSSNSIEDLKEAASQARRPDTRKVIASRILALAGRTGVEAANLEPRGQGPREAARPGSREGGPIEVAAGLKAKETHLRLTPGNGLAEGFSDCPDCPEMIVIPSGQAVIGSRPENGGYKPEEAPAHRISVRKPLAVSKYGVSASNWRACVDAGVCRPTLSSFLTTGLNIPATRVSWFDAKGYVEWLARATGRRYRLLTEAEWEYAAQGGSMRHLPEAVSSDAGSSLPSALAMPRLGAGLRNLGSTKPNGWGLHPLPAHALEWVEDCWHPNYTAAPSDGSAWLSAGGGDCAYRVVRGPIGGDFGTRHVAARAREFADSRSPTLGFRVARDLPPPAKTALETSGGGVKAPFGD
jgi:formylglycine-generating enzyme required for sulfatase activity